MNSGRQTGADDAGRDAAFVIVHLNAWDPERHGPFFLQPLIEGFLSRRQCAASADNLPSPL
ncbi:MAG: hypothetical protein P4N41_17305 [Negativicutes bacterium]|nr:hypothetical protein [Negativicutes bacterium]